MQKKHIKEMQKKLELFSLFKNQNRGAKRKRLDYKFRKDEKIGFDNYNHNKDNSGGLQRAIKKLGAKTRGARRLRKHQ